MSTQPYDSTADTIEHISRVQCMLGHVTVNKERFAISDQLASILRNTCIELGWIKP